MRVFWFLIIFLCYSCQETQEDNDTRREAYVETKDVSDGNNTNQFIKSKKIGQIIQAYSQKFPLEKDVYEDSKLSYYLSFYQIDGDTGMSIVKQPFVFDLFPKWAFKKTPNPIPEPIGISYYKGMPIVIYDTQKRVGLQFYEKDSLNSPIPSAYYSHEEGFFFPYIPPMWHYLVKNGNFHLVAKSDSLIME